MNPQEHLQTWTCSCDTSDQTFVPASLTSADVPAPKLWRATSHPLRCCCHTCVHSPVLSCGYYSSPLCGSSHCLTPGSEPFFKKFIFKWKIMTLQYCVGFCHTSAWISHRFAYVPSLLNIPCHFFIDKHCLCTKYMPGPILDVIHKWIVVAKLKV